MNITSIKTKNKKLSIIKPTTMRRILQRSLKSSGWRDRRKGSWESGKEGIATCLLSQGPFVPNMDGRLIKMKVVKKMSKEFVCLLHLVPTTVFGANVGCLLIAF